MSTLLATKSGLSWDMIRRHARSPWLERDEDGMPIYMHSARCPNFCDYACNGQHGSNIALDVERLEEASE